MITQDLGIATAYGYAKSKGYTGTEAEFAELMASYAEVGQTAADAAESALNSKTAAQTAATTATNKATEATTAATTATTKAGEASTSANTATSAKDTAVSAASTATTKATEATTAAATATSAKTDAVAANTAAQSAKTAAQTAQAGAETAAASVSASAEQIATNAEDISQLKSDLNAVNDLTTYVMDDSYSGSSINYDGYDSDRALTATGKDVVTGSVILSFPVTAGTLLKVSLKNRTGGNILYFFQDTKSVPWDGNTHIIGNINYGDRFVGYIYVPTGATHLVTNADISEITSAVSNVTSYKLAAELHIEQITKKSALNINWINAGWYATFISPMSCRVANAELYTVQIPFILSIKSGYRYGVGRYNSEGVRISDTGWLTGKHIIYPNDRVGITITRNPEDTSETADIYEFTNALSFYSAASITEESEYSYTGVPIGLKRNKIVISDTGLSISTPTGYIKQGGTIYRDKFFQAFSNNYMSIYDISTKTLESSFEITCGHGDCISFSNEFYIEGDTYPLLYATADTTPAKVYVNRINNGSATLIRTLDFPSNAGYYGGHVIDTEHNILYLIAYSENAFRSDANGNHMIVTKWDLSNLTDNGEGSYTPALLDTFTLPFIYTCQDQEFRNGKIFIISSYLASESPTRIVVVDPYVKSITNIITNINSQIVNGEAEVLTFLDATDETYMIVGDHSNIFKYQFF